MLPNVGSLDVQPTMQLCRALGDETRLRIVALLTHGELCSCHIEQALGLSQPNASRHLSVLKSAGIIQGRREGSWVHYRLASQSDDTRRKLLATVVKSFGAHETLRKDVDRVLKAKGSTACR